MDAEHTLELLAAAYRNLHVRICGEDGLPAAADALKSARLARLTKPAQDLEKRGPLVCASEHVLVWPRGYRAGKIGEKAERLYVGWHPSMGLDVLLHMPEGALELVAV
jgi:hypothetical protein